MNKKYLLIGIIALLLLIGGYFVFKKSSPTNSPGNQNSQAPKSLKDLFTAGIAQKCTFSTGGDSSAQDGTTYIANGKLRGDFVTDIDGKSTQTHMIVVSNTSYIWMDGQNTGFKSTFNPSDYEAAESGDSGKDTTAGLDFNKQADYKCSAWVVDDSLFTPPVDVKFSDFSELMKPAAVTPGEPSSGTQCSVCDSLSGEDKTQCRTALSCK